MNQSIFQKAAEKAKKWQHLEELLRDEEIANFLEKEFASRQQVSGLKAEDTVSNVGRLSTRIAYKRGDVLKTVKLICREFLPLSPFTAADVKARMDSRGFPFAAKDPLITINGALRKLVRRGVLRVHTQGTGRAPSKYEVPPKD